jgi:hypothetical protein
MSDCYGWTYFKSERIKLSLIEQRELFLNTEDIKLSILLSSFANSIIDLHS